MPDPNDITLTQAEQIGDHLMPKFELALQRKLEPIETRLAAIEQSEAKRSRGYHALTSAATFIGTIFSVSILDLVKGKQ